ncbi:MAG: hypothetical protein HY901_28840 [Deltaproteobacteria bacterium]|nr:hypothetical protein [Deltaproteobacteria bacterium]
MKNRASWIPAIALLLALSCNEGTQIGWGDASLVNLPSQQEISDARTLASNAVRAADAARTALELLGLLPTYECGEPRRTFVGRIVPQVHVDLPCATASTFAVDSDADAVVLTFSGAECTARGHTLAGKLTFRYSGGEDRMDVAVDFSEATIDGQALPATAGYGTCGDEKRVWAKAEGDLPELSSLPRLHLKIDALVALREGLPIIGGTDVVVDATGVLSRDSKTDQLTMAKVKYGLGEYLPEEGTVTVATADGHRIVITFTPVLWKLGQATVVIDGKDPVTIPIVH